MTRLILIGAAGAQIDPIQEHAGGKTHLPMVDLMITVNLDVGNTLANGTQGEVKRVMLKPSQNPHRQKIDEHTVGCVHASQVDHLLSLANGKL